MKLGLLLPTLHSVEVNAGALNAAEQLGADDVWVLDHMMGFTHPDLWRHFPASAALPDPDALLDPFVVAAALGPTTDLRVGLSVTDATRRPQPRCGGHGPRIRPCARPRRGQVTVRGI